MADVKLLGYSVSEMSFVNNIQKTETAGRCTQDDIQAAFPAYQGDNNLADGGGECTADLLPRHKH